MPTHKLVTLGGLSQSQFSFVDEQSPVAQGQAWGRPVNLSVHFDECSRCRAPNNWCMASHAPPTTPHRGTHAIKTKLWRNDAGRCRNNTLAQHILIRSAALAYHHTAIIWGLEC